MKLTKELKPTRGETATILFINNLRKLFYITNITNEEMSDAVGIDKRLIYDYIKGAKIPKINTMLKFCKFFNVSMDDMLSKKVEITYKFIDVEMERSDSNEKI